VEISKPKYGIIYTFMLLQGGQHHRLNDPDTEKIKMTIGGYYDYFIKRSEDNDVVFTVPYNDSGGCGKKTNYVRQILLQIAFYPKRANFQILINCLLILFVILLLLANLCK